VVLKKHQINSTLRWQGKASNRSNNIKRCLPVI